jgi:hypothetical protein
MALFIDTDYYVETPLNPTYEAAFRDMPEFWRAFVE